MKWFYPLSWCLNFICFMFLDIVMTWQLLNRLRGRGACACEKIQKWLLACGKIEFYPIIWKKHYGSISSHMVPYLHAQTPISQTTVLVKSFAHLMLWIFCDPPERGGLTLPISSRNARKKFPFKCAKLLTKTVFWHRPIEAVSSLSSPCFSLGLITTPHRVQLVSLCDVVISPSEKMREAETWNSFYGVLYGLLLFLCQMVWVGKHHSTNKWPVNQEPEIPCKVNSKASNVLHM